MRCTDGARFWTGAALLALPFWALAAVFRLLDGWAIYTEEQVLGANVLHPLFNSVEHFAEAHWRPTMLQQERLQGITEAYNGTVLALRKLGVNAFLESSSLIGLLRHGGHMPWEVDGDVGVVKAECDAAKASKSALSGVIGEELEVLKFGCACEEDCGGDNRRMAGRVAHRGTGVVIDIFMYAPVKEPRPWQRTPRFSGREWWERVDDHADYTFPREALLPLQAGAFEGVEMQLPQLPREFLSWEYGQCLGTHAWPWRVLLYCPVSVLVPAAVVTKGAGMLYGPRAAGGRKNSPWFSVVSGAYAAAALGTFEGGVTLIMLLVGWLCEMAAVLLAPELLGASCGGCSQQARRTRRRLHLILLVALAVLAFELRGVLAQLLCQLDDFYLHPLRPKSWTLCLFGRCWDF